MTATRTQSRIMIVEDESIIASDIALQLEGFGYNVVAMCTTGQQALERIEGANERPDLILMDIMLAGALDGIETARRITERVDVPIVYLTAFLNDQMLERIKSTEFFGYIIKPFEPRVLRMSIETALHKHRLAMRVSHLNRVLRAIRNVNQLITKIKEPTQLIQRVCELLVETRGYSSAWLGLCSNTSATEPEGSGEPCDSDHARITALGFARDDTTTRTLPAVLELGPIDADHILAPLFASDAPRLLFVNPLAPGSAAPSVNSEEKSTIGDEEMIIAARIEHDKQCYGCMAVALPGTVATDPEERSLFIELVDDIAFALHSITIEAERQRAQAALGASEARFRAMAENIRDGLTIIEDGTVVYTNPRITQITGYTAEELSTLGPRLAAPHERDRVESIMADAKRTGQLPDELEYWIQCKDGAQRCISNRYSLRHQPDGTLIRYVVTSDITNRKRTEAALQTQIDREQLIAQLSSMIAQLPVDRLEDGFATALGRVGRFLAVERSLLFLFDEPGQSMSVETEWTKNGIEPFGEAFRSIPVAQLQWGIEQLRNGHPLRIPTLAALPETATARQLLEAEGITALLAVPIILGDRLFGLLAVCTQSGERSWSDDTLVLLQFVAEVLANALERRETTRAVHESETRFATFMEYLPAVAFIKDATGRIISMNPEMERLFNSGAWLGKTVNEVMPPAIAEQMASDDERAITSGPIVIEEELPVATGQRRWFQTCKFPIRHPNKPPSLGGIAIDITDRKNAETALRISEERFREMADTLPEAVFELIMHEDGVARFRYVNQPGLERWGYTKADLEQGLTITDVFHADSIPLFYENARRDLEGAPIDLTEYTAQEKDGSTFPVRVYSALIMSDGKPIGFRGICVDITDQKEVERALAESEAKYRQIIENMQDNYYYRTDLDGRLLMASPGAAELLGLDPADQFGDPIIHFHAEPNQRKQFTEELFKHGKIKNFENTLTHADGSVVTVITNSHLIYDDMGTPVGIEGIISDITERKAIEQQLQEKEQLLTSILSASGIGISYAKDRKIVWANKAMEEIFGYERDTYTGKSTRILYPSDEEFERVGRTVYPILRDGSVAKMDASFIRQDNTVFKGHITVSLLDWADPEQGIIVNIIDINEREHAKHILEIERNLGLEMSTSDSLEQTLTHCLDAAIGIAECDSGGIYLVDEDGSLDLAVHTGLGDRFIEQVRRYAPNSSNARLVNRGEPLYADGERFSQIGGPEIGEGLTLGAVLPIIFEGKVVAALNIASHSLTELTRLARVGLETIASHLGASIMHAKQKAALATFRRDLATLVDTIGDCLFILDLEGRFVFVNSVCTERLGYAAAELSGDRYTRIHPEDQTEAVTALFASIVNGELDTSTIPLLAKDGTSIPVETKYTVGSWEGEAVIICTSRDMTERERAEAAVRESEEKYRSLVEHAHDGIVIIQDEVVRYVNSALVRMWGGPREAVIGTGFIGYIAPEARATVIERYKRRMAGETVPPIYETLLRRMDGSELAVELSAAQIIYQGAPADQVIVRDVTSRKETEAKLRAALQEKEVLLKEVHHRVKNNLQVISSLLRLQSRYVEDEKYRQMFMESFNRVRSMALIHDKLYRSDDFAQIDFADYLRNLVASLFRTYDITHQTVRYDLAVVPIPFGIDIAIPCGLIINELVSNALKYAFPNGREGTVSISFHPCGPTELELVVADDGVGMPAHIDIESWDSLGLQLVSIIAKDQLRGRIEVDREAGTSIRICFDPQTVIRSDQGR